MATVRVLPADRAAEERPTCVICLSNVPPGQTAHLQATPECSHTFHLECVETWTRVRAECPLCRARVHAIRTATGELRAVAVAVAVAERSDDDDYICEQCHRGDREADLLICDGCDMNAAHFDCVHLAGVPEGDWFCAACTRRRRRRRAVPAARRVQETAAGDDVDLAWRDEALASALPMASSAQSPEALLGALDKAIARAAFSKDCAGVARALAHTARALDSGAQRAALVRLGLLSRLRAVLCLEGQRDAQALRHLRFAVLHELVRLDDAVDLRALQASQLSGTLLHGVLQAHGHPQAVRLAARLVASWARLCPQAPLPVAFPPPVKRPRVRG